MKTRIFLILLATVAISGCSREVTSEDWRADLRDLEQQLAERHVDLYHEVSEQEFKSAVDDLYDRIPELSPPEILVEIAQLVALVGDGHTSIYPGNQKKWFFGLYPLRLYSFADGIYPIAVSAEYAHLFGKRLVQIDATPIDEAFRIISTTVGADNDMEFQYIVPFELIRPEMLHALGIANSPDRAEFVFEDGTSEVFEGMTEEEWHDLDWLVANGTYAPELKSPSMRFEFLFATSLTRPHLEQRKYYWYTYLEAKKTVYLQYNVCWDKKDDITFAAMVEEMFEFMDGNPVDRLVVDLRQNTGGEPMIAEPLIKGLEQRPDLGAGGRLFVLVGRRTCSAAVTNAAHLRSRAGARLVGEPPRGKPNSPSEGRDIDLERTKIWVTVSTQFVERDPSLGDADYLPVEIEAALKYDDLRQAKDPVLEAALNARVGREFQHGPGKWTKPGP